MNALPYDGAGNNKPALSRAHPGIAVSITNEQGQNRRYHANAVSLQMKRGVLQIIERDGRCFLWLEGCDLEVCEHRRNVLFQLLAGSASSDGTELTIVAEVAHRMDDTTAAGHSPCAFARGRTLEKKNNAPPPDRRPRRLPRRFP